MKNNGSQENFSKIKYLILKEEEEALRIFRKSNFRSQLAERIKSESKKGSSFPFWLKKPIPALGICLLLFFLGVIAFISIFIPSPYEKNLKSIEKFLRQTPGYQRFVKNKVEDVIILTMDNEYSELEWAIKRVLFSIYKETLSKKDLPTIIAQIFLNLPAEQNEEKAPIIMEDYNILNLDRKIEALKKRKKVYHFLLTFSKIKREEV